MEPSVELLSLDLLYTETRDRVIRQSTTIEHINTKASIIIGFDGVLLGVLVSVLTTMGRPQSALDAVWQSWVLPVAVSVPALLALVSLLCALISFRPTSYKEVLDPEGAYYELLYKPLETAKHELLKSMVCSYKETNQAISGNLVWFGWSLRLLGASVFATAVAAGLYVYSIL